MLAASALRCAVLLLAGPVPGTEVAPLGLDEALALARGANPALQAARLRSAVDAAGVAVARERPNPELRYERAKETPHDSIGLVQVLEIGGKRGRRIEVAEAGVRVGEAELAQTEVEVLAEVEKAFFTLAGAQRRQIMGDELRDLTARARDAAQERYDAGDVSRLDLVQAQLVVAQAESEVTAQRGEIEAARLDLNFRIGREPGVPTRVADDVAIDGLEVGGAAGATAPVTNTAIEILDRQIKEAEAKVALARAERVPDLSLEATATHDAEPEFLWGYRAAVALSIPLFTRHNGQVQVEDANLALLRAQRAATEAQLRGLAAAASARAAAQKEQYRRYREAILPQAREAEAMAEESYRAGQTNLTAFLQSMQSARDIRVRALQAASDYESALAELRRTLKGGIK